VLWAAVRFVLAFGGVLLLAAAATRWLAAHVRAGRGSPLEVLGAVGLGGQRQVCAVRVGRRVLVLGVAEQQVSLLLVVHDPEEVAELLAPAAASRRPGGGGTTDGGD
jgi:flagellar biogenesis protein FliO